MSKKHAKCLRGSALAAGMVGAGLMAASASAEPSRPNILFILADDLGWTDLQTGSTSLGNGSDYHRTPFINALAEAGLSFTSAYACPLCSPTRASLMTGQYTTRHGIYTVGEGNRGDKDAQLLTPPANRHQLAGSAVTLAETLKSAGYDTYHIGKWHLGSDGQGTGPLDQGFDINFGGNGRGELETHFADASGDFDLPNVNPNGVPNQFFADRMTDRTIAYLDERLGRKGNKPVDHDPFFVYYSMYSVHTPLQAPQANLDRLSGVPAGQRHDNKTYAAMVENMDDNVGRLINYLETTDDPNNPGHKLIANTLVVFASDNGGLGGYAGAGLNFKEITDQSPLRGGKGMLSEGGIRVPLIVRWDGQIAANTISGTPVHLQDFYPTLASIAGADLPDGQAMDGVDLSPVLRGQTSRLERDTLYWHFPGYMETHTSKFRITPSSVALRDGRWKLFYFYETGTWALYDLQNDIGETTNLIDQYPDLAHAIGADLVDWLIETNAALPMLDSKPVPMPTPPVPEPTAAAAACLVGGCLITRRRRAAGICA